MDDRVLMELLVDLHREGERQGPGSESDTLRALSLTGLDPARALRVADIGSGTGASTLTLAAALPGAVVSAVDLAPEFLDVLEGRARDRGHGDRVATVVGSMDALAFEAESLDLIWSEGAVYSMGFRAGLEYWRGFLRPGGIVAVSEITWLHPAPPDEIRGHWAREYPEVATAAAKIRTLEELGYDLRGYFVLPPSSWLEGYYLPTEKRIPAFLARHGDRAEAMAVAAMERQEADLYRAYGEWFSYGFYVARRR